MRFLHLLTGCIAFAFSLSACSSDPPSASAPVDSGRFTDGEWHAGFPLRRVGDAFNDKIELVVAAPNGDVAVLHEARSNAEDYVGVRRLERFDGRGQLVVSVPVPDGTYIVDLVVHPSGEFTAVEVRPGNKEHWKDVWLRRLGSDFRTLREAPLRDRPSDHELLDYPFDRQPDGSSRLGEVSSLQASSDGIVRGWFALWTERHLVLAARGEEAVLSAWSYGTKVYAIDSNLDVRWSRQVMPNHGWMSNMAAREALSVDGAGRIAVAFPIDKETVDAYKKHFGQGDLVWSGPFFQTMVTRLSPDGQDAVSRIFAHDHDLIVAGVALRGDEVTLCGSASVERKIKEPNNTREWDLGWLRGNVNGGSVQTHTVDLQRDDIAYACNVDAQGGLLFAGVNDFVQVDTNSWVEFGQAFFYGVDAAGNETLRRTLRGPRHTDVQAFDWTANGAIVFAGTFDGPITHTPQPETSRKAMLGMYTR